jgi:hypothetical protein
VLYDPALPRAFTAEVTTDLRAELSGRAITACEVTELPDASALSDVRIERRGQGGVGIEVFDRTTDKRVARDVRFQRMPEAGRALAVAIAIDELLRASWAELTLRKPDVAARSLPEARTPTPPSAHERPPERSRELWLTLGVGYSHSTDPYDAIGATLGLSGTLYERLWLEGRMGIIRSLPQDVATGSVTSMGGTASLALGLCATPRGARLRACAGLQPRVDVLSLRAEGDEGTRGGEQLGALVIGAVVVHGAMALNEAWSLAARAAVGPTLHGLRFSDGDQVVGQLQGFMLEAGLSIEVRP